MKRLSHLLIALFVLLCCACGGGGSGSGTAQDGGASTASQTHDVRVRIDLGVRAQALDPLTSFTSVRVELLDSGGVNLASAPVNIPVAGATSVTAEFFGLASGSYKLRATGFNSSATVIAGPTVSDLSVQPGQAVASRLTLTVQLVERDFLYVAGANGISVFNSDPNTGVLSEIASSPFAVNRPDIILPGPQNRFLYTNLFLDNMLAQYEINRTTGALTLLNMVPTGNTPSGPTIDPQGQFLFVPHRAVVPTGTVGVYRIDQTTGVLTEIPNSPFVVAGSGNPQRAFTDPAGRFLFITDAQLNGQLFVMRIDRTTGDLTQTVGPFNAFAPAFRTFSATTNPAGTILYVTGNTPDVAVFDIDQVTGFLTPRGNFTTPATNLGDIIFDASRNIMYVLDFFPTNAVRFFSVNTNGDLVAELAGSPVLTGGNTPLIMKLAPDLTRLYAANFQNPGLVSGFLLNTAGVPTPVAGNPFASANAPFGMLLLRVTSLL